MKKQSRFWSIFLLVSFATLGASAQSFRVQCPPSTITHPVAGNNNSEPGYSGPTYTGTTGYPAAPANVNGAIKCQQISGGDGYATMRDGTQTYMFSFGPLSGIADIAAGLPDTQFPSIFNTVYQGTLIPDDPATTDGANNAGTNDPGILGGFTFNGAIGLIGDQNVFVNDGSGGNLCVSANPPAACLTGHVDPRQMLDVGVMNGNIPAPLMAIDEDDEFFLTLSNVGMIMRPDLFEQHTVHFHGYPNASAFYDGVPDASVAINIGGSFTYYYMAPDAGTYFWHCHITPPEHLQMGMVGQLYVRPRQNRWSGTLLAGLQQQQLDLRTKCDSTTDILCSNPLPAVSTGLSNDGTQKYAYNDGDGSTRYDVEYPL